MKNSKPFALWLGIFVLGFVSGVVFSAWKLDTKGSPSMPPHPMAAQGQGEQHDHAAETRMRIAGLEKLVQAEPKNVQALVQLGNDYFDTGSFDKAVITYSKSLELDPKNPDVLTDLGISYRKIGKPKECVESFRKALEVNPKHELALFNLGLVLKDDMKDDAGAIQVWKKFLELAQNSPYRGMVTALVDKLEKKTSQTPAPEKK